MLFNFISVNIKNDHLLHMRCLKQGLFDTKYQTFDKRGLSKKIAKQKPAFLQTK